MVTHDNKAADYATRVIDLESYIIAHNTALLKNKAPLNNAVSPLNDALIRVTP